MSFTDLIWFIKIDIIVFILVIIALCISRIYLYEALRNSNLDIERVKSMVIFIVIVSVLLFKRDYIVDCFEDGCYWITLWLNGSLS